MGPYYGRYKSGGGYFIFCNNKILHTAAQIWHGFSKISRREKYTLKTLWPAFWKCVIEKIIRYGFMQILFIASIPEGIKH